jgi:hypothetical protein
MGSPGGKRTDGRIPGERQNRTGSFPPVPYHPCAECLLGSRIAADRISISAAGDRLHSRTTQCLGAALAFIGILPADPRVSIERSKAGTGHQRPRRPINYSGRLGAVRRYTFGPTRASAKGDTANRSAPRYPGICWGKTGGSSMRSRRARSTPSGWRAVWDSRILGNGNCSAPDRCGWIRSGRPLGRDKPPVHSG